MELKQTIDRRHAYRALKPVTIDKPDTEYLAWAAHLAPSCFNNQPWRYIFINSQDKLQELRPALSKGNEWAYDGSLIIAVYSDKDLDCIVAEREYYLFDTGISVGFLLLAATDLGYVAHPIAGFSEKKAKKILKIPNDKRLVTLIILGKHAKDKVEQLSDKDKEKELTRPQRKKFTDFISWNEYEEKGDQS